MRAPLLNFEGVLESHFQTLGGVPGPTIKLWEGSRIPGSWSHFYIMPLFSLFPILIYFAHILSHNML